MKTTILPLLFFLFIGFISAARVAAQSAPEVMWQKQLGGSNTESASCIRNTGDGGYIVAAVSASNDGHVTGNHGGDDIWVVKLDAQAEIQWQYSLGGSDTEEACSIEQTRDGGYIVLGTSVSNDGDLSQNNGRRDIWVVKLNANGAMEWQRSLGGDADEEAAAIAQTQDNGFVIAGTALHGDEFAGDRNYWAAKLNAQGAVEWQKEFGGSSNDVANALMVTEDDDYILAGVSYSEDGDLPSNIVGDYVCWLVKVNSSGNIIWSKCYDGANGHVISAIYIQPNRYMFLAAKGASSEIYHLLFTIDKQGAVIADTKHYFPEGYLGDELIRTSDNGYIMTGSVVEYDSAVGLTNFGTWLVRFAADGSIQWEKKLLSNENDSVGYFGQSTAETSDGGFLVAGVATKLDTVENTNMWLMKLGDTSVPTSVATVVNRQLDVWLYPNPAEDYLVIEAPASMGTPQSAAIYNMLGKTMMENIPVPSAAPWQVDISTLPAGIYMLNLQFTETVQTLKFIKK